MRHSLGLATCTTGKGKVALDPNTRPIEVYMCSVVSGSREGLAQQCRGWAAGWLAARRNEALMLADCKQGQL